MPSKNMVRYPIDFYPSQSHKVLQITVKENVKRVRFLRECVLHVITSPTETKKVITKCRSVNYIRNEK